jgi:hypothetical protein
MADLTALQQADSDLKAAVAAAVANMDKLFADLKAAGTDQSAIDAITADFQAQVAAINSAVSADPAP